VPVLFRAVVRAVVLVVAATILSTLPFAPSVAASTIDGVAAGGGQIPAGGMIDLAVLGRGGVPASGVGAVALNVTVTAPTESSYLTVFPTGAARPHASNLNFVAGQTVPNMVIVPVGAGGQVSIFNAAGAVEVVADVLGWFPTGAAYTGLTPARILDTRPGGATVDGQGSGQGAIPGGAALTLPIAGRGGVPASGAGAVALNVTVTEPSAASFVTVWPSGTERPLASNLNVGPGQTVPNMVIAPLGADGAVSIFNAEGNTHVLVDVLGWFPTGAAFNGLNPARVLDTRPTGATIDGRALAGGAVPAGAIFTLPVLGRAGVPDSGVGAVVLNVTITEPTEPTYLTVWPSATTRPDASNLNATAGQTIPNLVIAQVGPDGAVAIYNAAGHTHVIADILGWFPTTNTYTPLNPARLLDTRNAATPALRAFLASWLAGDQVGMRPYTTSPTLANIDAVVATRFPPWEILGVDRCPTTPGRRSCEILLADQSRQCCGLIYRLTYEATTQGVKVESLSFRGDAG
jgi:hypothetical protein